MNLTREQIELIKRNAQQSICVENGETLSALCDMALCSAEAQPVANDQWMLDEVRRIGEIQNGNSVEVATTLWNHIVRHVAHTGVSDEIHS